jgi:histidyl-tRNA synthetase
VFEFTSDALGAQSGVGGGGRYDGLVEQFGGPPTPCIGWAAGVERILLAAGRELVSGSVVEVFIAVPKEERRQEGFRLWRQVRGERSVLMGEPGRSMKGQMKQADRVGARWTVIVEDDGFELKDMKSGEQRPIANADELMKALT